MKPLNAAELLLCPVESVCWRDVPVMPDDQFAVAEANKTLSTLVTYQELIRDQIAPIEDSGIEATIVRLSDFLAARFEILFPLHEVKRDA